MILHQHRNPVFQQLFSRRIATHEIIKRQNRFGLPKLSTRPLEFIPVQISGTKDLEQDQVPVSSPNQKIEISFPDGIRVILSGNDSLSAAKSILSIV